MNGIVLLQQHLPIYYKGNFFWYKVNKVNKIEVIPTYSRININKLFQSQEFRIH